MAAGLGLALASRFAVAHLGLGTASRFCLLAKHRSGVLVQAGSASRHFLPAPSLVTSFLVRLRDLDSNQDTELQRPMSYH